MDRQAWLDSLKVGSEVAVEWSDQVVKVFPVEAIISKDGFDRVFVAGRLSFTPDGIRIGLEDYANLPGYCKLENPDGGWMSGSTRREMSRFFHVREVFARILTSPVTQLTCEQMERMIKVVYPDYEPKWNL